MAIAPGPPVRSKWSDKTWIYGSLISSRGKRALAPRTTNRSASFCRGARASLFGITQGHRYLDCLSAYSAVNQGHCHPKILAAMVEQAGRLTLTSRAFHNDQLALFYEEIAALTGSHKVLPMNSGAEAVESAISRCANGAMR